MESVSVARIERTRRRRPSTPSPAGERERERGAMAETSGHGTRARPWAVPGRGPIPPSETDRLMTDELRAILPGGEGTEAFSRQATLLVRHTRTRRRHAPAPETRAPIERFRCPADARARVRRRSACPHCAESDAKRAYRNLARAFHPDKGGDARRFQDVQRAYEHLASGWRRDAEARARAAESARRTVKSSGEAGARGAPSSWVDLATKDRRPRWTVARKTSRRPAVMPGENLAELGDEALRGRLRSRGRVLRRRPRRTPASTTTRPCTDPAPPRTRGPGQWEHSCSDADRAHRGSGGSGSNRGSFARRRWSGFSDGPPRWRQACRGGVGDTRGAGGSSHPGGGKGNDGAGHDVRGKIADGAGAGAALAARSCRPRSSPRIKPPSPPSPSRRGGRSMRRTSSTGRRAVRTNTIGSATSGADGAVSLWWIPATLAICLTPRR